MISSFVLPPYHLVFVVKTVEMPGCRGESFVGGVLTVILETSIKSMGSKTVKQRLIVLHGPFLVASCKKSGESNLTRESNDTIHFKEYNVRFHALRTVTCAIVQ